MKRVALERNLPFLICPIILVIDQAAIVWNETVFLVKDFAALEFWQKRLTEFEVENKGIQAFGNGHILNFQDEDGQLLGLTYHNAIGEMFPYKTDEIPSEYAILGIASLHMRIREEKALLSLLTETFGFVEESRFVFEDKIVISLLFDNTFQHRLYLILDQESPISVMGVGAIHHIAFGVLDESDLEDLISRLNLINRPHSGIINRDFIHSLYFRAPNYLMFEVATMTGERESEMPAQNEELDQVDLFLPSFFEEDRQEIEKNSLPTLLGEMRYGLSLYQRDKSPSFGLFPRHRWQQGIHALSPPTAGSKSFCPFLGWKLGSR